MVDDFNLFHAAFVAELHIILDILHSRRSYTLVVGLVVLLGVSAFIGSAFSRLESFAVSASFPVAKKSQYYLFQVEFWVSIFI